MRLTAVLALALVLTACASSSIKGRSVFSQRPFIYGRTHHDGTSRAGVAHRGVTSAASRIVRRGRT